jgi:nucleotide-binding universal stress UspA family protein
VRRAEKLYGALTARNDLSPAADVAGDPGRASRGVILHPTDYSESSGRAFELACRLALDRESLLIVMHVAEPVRLFSPGMAPLPQFPKGYRGAWESRLRLLRPADANVRVEYRLEEGDVAAAILRVACEVPCDLIVMAGRERSWLGRLFTSSVAEKVGWKALCPVLTLTSQRPGEVVETVGRDSKAGRMPSPATTARPRSRPRSARSRCAWAACTRRRESAWTWRPWSR